MPFLLHLVKVLKKPQLASNILNIDRIIVITVNIGITPIFNFFQNT